MMHHIPLTENLPEHEDLKVHIPGTTAGDIIIHTEVVSATPRASLLDEQSAKVFIFPNYFD